MPDSAVAPEPSLLLFSRQGCCLCEGLEQKLRTLPLPLALQVVDVDGDAALQQRYGLEVPVLALNGTGGLRILPRVSPRLPEPQLLRWLLQQIAALST